LNPIIAALASITISALAQIILKSGMTQVVATNPAAKDGRFPVEQLFSALLNPLVASGFVLYGLGAVIWLYVLARWDVSKAYPLVGFGFVLTALFALFWLGERLSLERIAGTVLICAGIFFISRS
jgi:drug/metabolite transporter (DMT)-like permease